MRELRATMILEGYEIQNDRVAHLLYGYLTAAGLLRAGAAIERAARGSTTEILEPTSDVLAVVEDWLARIPPTDPTHHEVASIRDAIVRRQT